MEPVPELPRTDEHHNAQSRASLAPERVEFVEQAPCSPWRVWGTRCGSLLLVVGVVFGVVTGMGDPETEVTYEHVATETVSRGPFQIFITERGMVDSAQNVMLSSKVYWTTSIVKLIPEGTRVKEGELLCELDSTELREKAKTNQVVLIQSEAAAKQAREDLRIQELLNDRNVARAKLRADLAKLDLEKFEKGTFVQQRETLSGQIALAQSELTRSEENHSFTKRIAKKGYSSQSDVEKVRIAVQSAEIKLETAQGKQSILERFTYERTMAELKANAAEFERELDRVKRKAKAAILQLSVRVTARERKEESYREKYESYLELIEHCLIRAPQDGEVVYARDYYSMSGAGAIEEGAPVRYRQDLIKLPDLDHMQVETRIHETRIENIREGQPVHVQVSALPDESFHGEVDTISGVPNSRDRFRPDRKEYATSIRLLDDEMLSQLRPGMTAQIDIEVENRSDVL